MSIYVPGLPGCEQGDGVCECGAPATCSASAGWNPAAYGGRGGPAHTELCEVCCDERCREEAAQRGPAPSY